jgi:CDP-diacylglycerol--serine O-phosphatidyltransferase
VTTPPVRDRDGQDGPPGRDGRDALAGPASGDGGALHAGALHAGAGGHALLADEAPPRRRRHLRRAAPALPNGLTLGNLFFGIFAIIAASRQNFNTAVWCIVAGGVCDAFDGAVARATRTGGRFGEELDSLVDAISFGFAPAMIVYFAVLPRDGWAWLPVFVYAACAVIRLARFNVTQAGSSKAYFIGLPSPAAGGTLATYYWFTQTRLYQETRIVDLPWQEIMPALMLVLAAMMISSVPYPTWPKVGVRTWRQVGGLLLVLGILVGTIFFRQYFLFLFGVGYLGFGLVRAVVLGLVELPPDGGPPRRRRTDYVDPLEAYGTEPLDDDAYAPRRRRFGRRRRVRAGGGPPPAP